MTGKIAVIGGGLAGCEIAWQLAMADIPVTIFEMKPTCYSPAHQNPDLGELVCSNSLRSMDPFSAVGLLKEEMRQVNSLIMSAADKTRVPAGKALAVDRDKFAELITQTLEQNPYVEIIRREVENLSDPVLSRFSRLIIAAGPLAGSSLTKSLLGRIGQEDLYFYDAIAPIVSADSIDWNQVYCASRYDPDSKDYVNCPLDEQQYHNLRSAMLQGIKVSGRHFEEQTHFEACLPVETLAERGAMTLAFGPLKPVGLEDPRTGKRPFAVVQLRPENREKTMFNMVGFQTKLTYREQERIFRMIPGLEKANFVRLGSIHRNTYVNSPRVLSPSLEVLANPGLYLAGQITGVEGYVESAACGLWLGIFLAQMQREKNISLPPPESAMGALLRHLQTPAENFQPMNVNFGLMPALKAKVKKAKRKEMYVDRARKAWNEWCKYLT